MKKKSLLIFLLTAVSTTAVGAVWASGCTTNDEEHKHSYSWNFNSEEHWQECDGCTEKTSPNPHVDILDNQSHSEGADGKCDICGLEHYAVSFEMNGHGSAPASQDVYKGGKATKPATDPTATDYEFGGWFADEDCETPFDFDSAVTSAKTVYAKWTSVIKVTVTFDMQGCGTAPEVQRVALGKKASEPASTPVDKNADYLFDGWYSDAECTTPFNFNTEITEDTTIYAKWVEDTRPLVIYDLGGHADNIKVRVDEGSHAEELPDPELDGVLLESWCADAECETEFDFDAPITGDVTIYAKFVRDSRALIIFDVQGHGTAPEKQKVENGGFLTKPEDPHADGYTFAGWFVSPNYSLEFDFENDEVTDSMTLYAKWTVTVSFNMNGHGDAVAEEEVVVGGTVSTVVPTTDENYTFDGWYTNQSCTEEFDFSAPVTSAVTLYAKWSVAVVQLVLDSSKLVTFDNEDSLQFSFVASEEGRYQISPFNLKTYSCYFTTDLDDDGVYYGDGYADNDKYFDLARGEKVTITLYRGNGVGNDDKVSLIVNRVTNEPFPADGWVSGEYTGGSYSLTFNKENKVVEMYNQTWSITSYLGGSFNRVTFTANETVYTLIEVAPDTLQMLYPGRDGTTTVTLTRVIPQDPLDISAFGGVYTPVNGKVNSVETISIYASGNSNFGNTKYTLGTSGSSYNGQKNIITYQNYTVTANLDGSGNVISINVSYNSGAVYVYNKTGDTPKEIPEKLPFYTNIDLAGEKLGISYSNGTQKWSDGTALTITDYNEATGKYTVTKSTATYILTFSGSGDDTVVKVYDSSDALYDTLTKKVAKALTLLTDGSQNTFKSADLYGNWKSVFYEITETGTYTFTASNKYLTLYTNVEDFTVTGMGGKYFTSTVEVDLKEGTVIAISASDCGSAFSSGWITATFEVKSDSGEETGGTVTGSGTQADPYVWNGAELLTLSLANGSTCYVTFAPAAGGTYKLKLPTNESGSYFVGVQINGVKYGYDANAWKYYYEDEIDTSYTSKDGIVIEVAEGETVSFVVTQGGFGATEAYLELV